MDKKPLLWYEWRSCHLLVPFPVVPGLNPIRGAGGRLRKPVPPKIFRVQLIQYLSYDHQNRCLFLILHCASYGVFFGGGKILIRGGFRATFLGYLRLPWSSCVFFRINSQRASYVQGHMGKGIQNTDITLTNNLKKSPVNQTSTESASRYPSANAPIRPRLKLACGHVLVSGQ